MPVEKSYARLGFFIVVTFAVLLVTAVFFIQRLKRRPAIGMVTYTTDNVFGLDVSSAVRLRGVPVGRVTNIRVDPLGTIVEIDFDVYLDRLNTRVMTELQLDGRVFPSNAVVHGRTAIRSCIVGYRTEAEHLQRLLDLTTEIGARVHDAGLAV